MEFTVVTMIEGIGLFLAAGCLIWFFYSHIKSEKRNRLPVVTDKAVVYQKHPDPVYVPGAGSRYNTGSSYVYYITFHTDSGLILKLYVNPDVFYTIEEDSRGELTWQGDRFWKFLQAEGKEQ